MIKRKVLCVGLIVLALLLGAGYGLAQTSQPAEPEADTVSADTSAPADAAALASGASNTGGDFLISMVGSEQEEPAVAHNPDLDQHLVVWVEGDDIYEEDHDIYGQIFTAKGVPQGGSFPICTNSASQGSPAVVYNPLPVGEYLVVWDDGRGGIYGQRVDADGTLSDAGDPTVNFAISTNEHTQRDPAVAYNDATDEYLVVWVDSRNGSYDIYGQRVDADGVLLGDGDPTVNFAISTAGDDKDVPAIAYNDATDEYLVVWVDSRSSDRFGDIYGQRVRGDGLLIEGDFVICTAQYSQWYPAIAYNATANEYLVVWLDTRNDPQFHLHYDIYGQRVSANGALLGAGDPAVNFAIAAIEENEPAPAIAYDADHDQYLVVWDDSWYSQSSYGYSVYGQRVAGDGTLAEPGDFAISEINAQYPAVAYSAASQQFLVVWRDDRHGYKQSHIYGQRVWWPGLPVGRELAVSGQGTSQESSVAYNTREHHYLAVWADDTGGDFDIYGQLYDRYSNPIDGVFPIVELAGDQTNPDVIYNRDTLQYLVVFEGPSGIGGQLVTTQGSLHSGPFSIFKGLGFHNPAVAYAHNAAAGDVHYRHYLVVFNGLLYGSPAIYDAKVTGDGRVADTSAFSGDGVGPCDVVYNPTDNEFLFVWQGESAGEWNIYGRQIGVEHGAYGTTIGVSTAAGGQHRPRVAYNPDDNQYLVVWDDLRGGSDFDVYAQKINANGITDGSNFAVATSVISASQGYPAVIYANTVDRYHIVFQDNRYTSTLGWDLRGQWLGKDGANLGTLDAPLIRYPGNQLEPDIVYSDDSSYNKAFTAWEDTRSGSSDIYGSFDALDDDLPVARFTRDPGVFRRLGTTFVFNAWPSRDDVTPRSLLEVRWDVDGDGAWDDESFSYTKYVTHTFASTGWHTVTLEVRDEALLTDTLSMRVFTFGAAPDLAMDGAVAASGPTATLAISPAFKTSGETFTFDGTGSIGGVEARWDWENDGIFDTTFDSAFTATHVYTVAGDYTVRLEVRDSGGLSDVALNNVTVAPDDPVQLEVSPQMVTVIPGEVLRFRVTGWDQYDNVMYNPAATWTVSTGDVGVIDASGVFTASVEAGTYTDVVLVQSDLVSDTASVTIVWPDQVYLPLVLKGD